MISPGVLAAVSPDPGQSPDQLSARWPLALGARLVQEVGNLLTGAARARQRIATFAIEAEVRFASAADRAAFAEELSQAIAALVGRYHDESGAGGRSHRLIVGLHQVPAAQAPPAQNRQARDRPAPDRPANAAVAGQED